MPVSCRHASSAIGPGTRRRRRVTTPTAVCPSSSNLHRGSTPRWTTSAPRSPARSTSNRAWPCSSPPARGGPSSRGDSSPKPWAGSPVPSSDARRCRRCGRVPCSPRGCCTSVAPTSSRWRVWPTPSPRPRRAWATRRWPSPLDQESIFILMAHDWREREATVDDGTRAGRVATGDRRRAARHFAAVLALALGEVDDARALLHEAAAALDRVPEASSPFFTTLSVSWIVDDRGAVPLPVAEDTMLLGRRVGAAQARGHVAVAAALAERLGGRTDLALALLDDAIARFTALGDTFGTGYALGQRGHTLRWAGDLDGGARLLRCRRAGPPILARSALHRHGGRRAFLRRRPAGGGDRRPPPRPRSGVDDGTDAATSPASPTPSTSKGSSSWSSAPSTPPCHRWSGPCCWPTGGSRRSTRSAGSTCSWPTSATPSATPTHRLVPPPRRRRGSRRSAIGAVSEPCKARAKRVPSRCRPDHHFERGRHDTAARRRDHQRARRGTRAVPSCGPATMSTRRLATSGTAPSTSARR